MFSFEYLHSYISIWLMTPMLARNMALNFLANSGVAICPVRPCGAVGREPACVASKVCQLGDCEDRLSACAARYSPARVLVLLLSSLFSMLSGEIWDWMKPYLIVKISSDIVTEHFCQVCVLSMMFCRSVAVCWHGKLLRNQQETPRSTHMDLNS